MANEIESTLNREDREEYYKEILKIVKIYKICLKMSKEELTKFINKYVDELNAWSYEDEFGKLNFRSISSDIVLNFECVNDFVLFWKGGFPFQSYTVMPDELLRKLLIVLIFLDDFPLVKNLTEEEKITLYLKNRSAKDE